jgi:hypothetical protein
VSPTAEILSVAAGVGAPGIACPTVPVASVAQQACRASRSMAPAALVAATPAYALPSWSGPSGLSLLRHSVAARWPRGFPVPFAPPSHVGSPTGAAPASYLSHIPSGVGSPTNSGAPGSPSAASVTSSTASAGSNSGPGTRDIFMPPVDWATLNRFAYSFVCFLKMCIVCFY